MSWSFNATGKPELVAKALERHSEGLSGQSKIEFDDAMPHMAALVRQTFANRDYYRYDLPLLRFEASGSGSSMSIPGVGEIQSYRLLSAKIELIYGALLEDASV